MIYLCRKFILKTKKELPNFLKNQIILEDFQEERPLYDLRARSIERLFISGFQPDRRAI